MAGKADNSYATSPEGSPTMKAPMACPLLRKVFDKFLGFSSWRRNRPASGRRIFRRDVEQDDFQYASTHCLSSYYSVFVVRLAIMVMLAILIGLLTILTWHFTRSYTKRSLDTLAFGLRYELLQRPILRMWNILNSTSEITTAQVKLSEYVIKRYSNPATQAEQVELYEVMKDVTWAMFASRKALNAITITYKNGFVQAFHRDHRSNNTFYIYSNLVNYSISGNEPSDVNNLSSHKKWNEQAIHGNVSAIWYREPLDPVTGEKKGKASRIPPDDLINIAGFSEVQDGVASWHVAVSKYTDSPLLSAALPVRDASNESIVAVVGVTTALYSVGQLMRELVEVHSGHIYLTSQEGYLLATSTNAPLLRNSTTGPNLMMAVDSEDKIIKMGAQWLERVYGNKFPPGHIVHENAKLGHQQYYIDSFFLNLKRLPIVGVIIIPRRYIMGKVDERAFKTLVILISASVCILVIGCVCILILTNGVSKEMKLRAELISHLDARRRAEASNNYKSQFLANMSHELRTPMAAVIGLLDILISDDCLTNEQYATVTQIRKCSTALLRLLNNILDLSKVESGKLVLEDAEFDLGRELEGLIDMFSVQCINHNVEAVLDLSAGHIILRGWCENTFNGATKFPLDQKKARCTLKTKLRQQGNHIKKATKKENKVILWFEVDDTGCGIDPSKWETVFESFEQADPSTTRLHGGTGLGLCIVRTLVHKMGGEIKVVKKNGPGTLMRFYLLLNTTGDGAEHHCQVDFARHNVVILLALYGSMGRGIMSQWLHKIGLPSLGVSEWNELTQVLQELFYSRRHNNAFEARCSLNEPLKAVLNMQDVRDPLFVIVVDIGLLDLSTDIWMEQLNFLDMFSGKATFAWMLNHDTSNAIKMELRRKGHILMVNKPLYKAKMIQILETVIKEQQKKCLNAVRAITRDDMHECLEIDSTQFDNASSEDSDMPEMGNSNVLNALLHGDKQKERGRIKVSSQYETFKESLAELSDVHLEENNLRMEDACQIKPNLPDTKEETAILMKNEQTSFSTVSRSEIAKEREEHTENNCPKGNANSYSSKTVTERKALEGLRILLAEDTPVLQRVATIMLEKMGATVIAVGDGLQAVDALNCLPDTKERGRESPMQDGTKGSQIETRYSLPYDLILMDCQMPKMDGYEATKAIRKSEAGTGFHIPIVALTAHAMSSDEAKCLEVGMDAYLTKPIDYKLMVSTILSLAKRTT
ncbi:histidine kinase 1 isoform X2 [Manihot esculenta]|uniref:histidine kinase 1 isoform X2 n=1 Tax=Manihot esculenta TaxID=3983 RepID=UPI001CC5CEC9|nr:histidine kinase 1 isoform X2 [Manihot esculenta]